MSSCSSCCGGRGWLYFPAQEELCPVRAVGTGVGGEDHNLEILLVGTCFETENTCIYAY